MRQLQAASLGLAFVAGAAAGAVATSLLVVDSRPAQFGEQTRTQREAPTVRRAPPSRRRVASQLVELKPPRDDGPQVDARRAPTVRESPPIDFSGASRQSLNIAYDANIDIGSPIAKYTGPYTVPRVRSLNNVASQEGLVRARKSADALVAAGTAVDLDAMLRSSDDTERESAIGLAARADPPDLARLLRVARDASSPGSLRATALVAAATASPTDQRVAAAVADLLDDRIVDVRRTAVELLPGLGEAGADRAVALLRSGDYAAELLEPLARAVAASSRALDFLLANPEPTAAFAVLHAIDDTEPTDPTSRARLRSRLADAVRPLLGTPEMLVHAADAFRPLAVSGNVSFLRSVAVSTTLPTATRLAAIDAAIMPPACADGLASLFTATLSDQRSPVELLRATLERVPSALVADGGVKAAIGALARDHPNAWLREDARAKLQASPPPSEDGGLAIVSGVYGKDGKTVDVTRALASMVVGGRLVVEAGNALAGDPLVGVVKELSVTYVWKGARRTRTISEYETLTLP